MIDLSAFFRVRGETTEIFVTGLSLTFTKIVREGIDTSLSDKWMERIQWIGDTVAEYVPDLSSKPSIVLDCRMENFYLNYLGKYIIERFKLSPTQTKVLTTVEPKNVLSGYNFELDRLAQTNYCDFYDSLVAEDIDWKNIEIDRHIISLSGRATESRVRLTKSLIDMCGERARISFGGTTHYNVSEQDLKRFKEILYPNQFPVQIGTDDKVLGSILTQHTAPGYQLYKSLLAVVNETNDFTVDNIYFSEKSFKFFAWHQIPVFVASPKHVAAVRELGFDMFDDIIDHSYDNAKNLHLHDTMILNVIAKFLKEYPNLEEVNSLRQKIWPRLEANAKLLEEFNRTKKYEKWPYYG